MRLAEERKRNEAEKLRLKEWEQRFDADRKKLEEEEFLKEEELQQKEEERRQKLLSEEKNPNKIN